MPPTRMVVYNCTHELPDTDAYVQRAQATPFRYRSPIVSLLKRAFSLNETIRRPNNTHLVHAPSGSTDPKLRIPQPGNMDDPPDLPAFVQSPHVATPPPQANAHLANMPDGPPDLPVLQFPITTGTQPQTDDQLWKIPDGPSDLPSSDILNRGWNAMRRRGTHQRNFPEGLQRRATDAPRRSSPEPPPDPPKDEGVHPWVNAWMKKKITETLKKHHDRITQPQASESSGARPRTPVILIPDPLTLTPSTTRDEEGRPDSPTDNGMRFPEWL
ncbi:hypothetical protein BOTCAL_0143g00210 [Botryotinia calthae]|uniref:Uncharacterized protein n=1 Tax=Botryotinia calthae TaxID=38488 RepID=A0A4Y8D3H1_9HELO|nr:hypothetical protein BOTCAL_0143g00210 [Botryotinia calthae]